MTRLSAFVRRAPGARRGAAWGPGSPRAGPPPPRRYTYGYGRAEDLAGIVIVAVIVLSSAAAAYAAVSRLLHPHPVTHLAAVAIAAGLGFAGNELVARYRIRIGRRIGSAPPVPDRPHAPADRVPSP